MKRLTKIFFLVTALTISLQSGAATFYGERDDFRDETIYFAMTTRFYDGDPKNNVLSWDKQDVQIANNDPDWRGDFAGLIEKLDYIKALGFTAVWITPVTQNASGEDYHGYHSMDFGSVDLRYESRKEWGSEKDVKFQDLIDAAHSKGMKVILDIVLNHTSNFGEAYLNPLFTRDQNIRNQATPAGSLIPNYNRLSSNYFDQDGDAQYQERFKYFKNPQYDTHNYYHHYGTGWNWDEPNRWWGQIAGDCVDLNTENDYVAEYLVNCYGKFIEMGVDGFRIDTTGHISRLTFNTQFIPQFTALAEKYKAKRNNGPFFMFGECCARFGEVIYRNQHNLSSHFYTWKSNQSAINSFKSHSGPEWWNTQSLKEGHDSPVGPMTDCEAEKEFSKNSKNVFMQNGVWHEPDYSEYSGFSVIDFPMHYNFNNAASAVNIAKQGDQYYNDASYNVVYVDSHDYCPGPNDGVRFNGGTAQWAENLSLMFTFRGIPCIYYGSEVEFMKGKPIDVGGSNNKTPRKESGRAYFGHYITGNVNASDFGVYTASGNVAATLNGDLAQHIIRLNKIRAAVPALRKGQYTWDGCSANGGWAFKRAYKDSYALVAINGGATFSNLPAGTYVDLVTGQSYTAGQGGTITVSAPSTKGQLRVLVKDWKGGQVGEDGKFIYTSASVAKGGNPTFTDPGTTQYYTAKDVVGRPAVTFSPQGGSFKTETLDVTISLNESATSGWYQVGNEAKSDLKPGESKKLTIGNGLSFGETVTIKWEASDASDSYTGSISYKKVDPNAVITVYVNAPKGGNLYAWNGSTEFLGGWPGTSFSNLETVEIDGATYYYTYFDTETVNVIFNDNSGQTADIKNITSDAYFKYNGGTSYEKLDLNPNLPKKPSVTANPVSGTRFNESITVVLTANPDVPIYYTTDGTTPSTKSTVYKNGLTFNDNTTLKTYVENENGSNVQTFTYIKTDMSTEGCVYLQNTKGWSSPTVWAWVSDQENCTIAGAWPGDRMTQVSGDLWKWVVPVGKPMPLQIIFSNTGSEQTADLRYVDGATYNCNGIIIEGGTESPGAGDPSENDGFYVFFDNTLSNWNIVNVHFWGGTVSSSWPGYQMNYDTSQGLYFYKVPANTTGLVFNAGQNMEQTADFSATPNHIYNKNGDTGRVTEPSTNGLFQISDDLDDGEIHFYNMQGVEIKNPTKGFYIIRKGKQAQRILIP